MRRSVAQGGRAVAWFVMDRMMADANDAGRRCQLTMLVYEDDDDASRQRQRQCTVDTGRR